MRIATDTYSFKDLREGGYVYVDKTDAILPLVDGSIGKQFFCARPRQVSNSRVCLNNGIGGIIL